MLRRHWVLISSSVGLIIVLLPLLMPAPLLNLDIVRLHLLPRLAARSGITLHYHPITNWNWFGHITIPSIDIRQNGLQIQIKSIRYHPRSGITVSTLSIGMPSLPANKSSPSATTKLPIPLISWLPDITIQHLNLRAPELTWQGRLQLRSDAHALHLRINHSQWHLQKPIPLQGVFAANMTFNWQQKSLVLENIQISSPLISIKGSATALLKDRQHLRLQHSQIAIQYTLNPHTMMPWPKSASSNGILAAQGKLTLTIAAQAENRLSWVIHGDHQIHIANAPTIAWSSQLQGEADANGASLQLHHGEIRTPFAQLKLTSWLLTPLTRHAKGTLQLAWNLAQLPAPLRQRLAAIAQLSGTMQGDLMIDSQSANLALHSLQLQLPGLVDHFQTSGAIHHQFHRNQTQVDLPEFRVRGQKSGGIDWQDQGSINAKSTGNDQNQSIKINIIHTAKINTATLKGSLQSNTSMTLSPSDPYTLVLHEEGTLHAVRDGYTLATPLEFRLQSNPTMDRMPFTLHLQQSQIADTKQHPIITLRDTTISGTIYPKQAEANWQLQSDFSIKHAAIALPIFQLRAHGRILANYAKIAALTLDGASHMQLRLRDCELPFDINAANRPLKIQGTVTIPDIPFWLQAVQLDPTLRPKAESLSATLQWNLRRGADRWRLQGVAALTGKKLSLNGITLASIALKLPFQQRITLRDMRLINPRPLPSLTALITQSLDPTTRRGFGSLTLSGIGFGSLALGSMQWEMAWKNGHLMALPRGASLFGGNSGGMVELSVRGSLLQPKLLDKRLIGRFSLVDADLSPASNDHRGRFSLFTTLNKQDHPLQGRISLPTIGSNVPLLLIKQLDPDSHDANLQQAKRLITSLNYVPSSIDARLNTGFLDLDLKLKTPSGKQGFIIPLRNIALAQFISNLQ
ncbi:MAG: hypothetical protein Q9M26_04440 [Mariprofundales bacterium]|nr:hypothetical protein [Mariprofundales bacterium]